MHQVRTLPIKAPMIECAGKRNDNWGNEVLEGLENCNDLVIVEAIYHSICLAKFKLNKRMTGKKPGQTEKNKTMESVKEICQWALRTIYRERVP